MGPKKQSTSDVNTTIKGGAKSAKSAKSNKVSFDILPKGLNTIQDVPSELPTARSRSEKEKNSIRSSKESNELSQMGSDKISLAISSIDNLSARAKNTKKSNDSDSDTEEIELEDSDDSDIESVLNDTPQNIDDLSDDGSETKNDSDDDNDNLDDIDNDNDKDNGNADIDDDEEVETESVDNGNIEIDDCLIDDEEVLEEVEPVEVSTSKRVSFPKLTKYERVRILASRTKQLALGAPPFVKNVDKKSPAEIAIIELEYNMIPYLIKRPMPNNTYEIWRLSELEK